MSEIITRKYKPLKPSSKTGGVRTDVPMDGIHQVQKDLKTLDIILLAEPSRLETGISRPEFVRTILLGILAKLDAAIIRINES